MNESANLLSAMYLIINQLQTMKDKLDPEVFELLNTSGHEAISSAHHFLDACEKALDSIMETQMDTTESILEVDEVDLTEEETNNIDNIVSFNVREA